MRFATLESIAHDAAVSLRRFPLTLAFAWLACAACDAEILWGGDHPRLMAVALVASLGIAMSFAVAVFAERLGPGTRAMARSALLAAVPVVLAIVALRWTHWSDEVQWRRYMQLSLLGHLLVAVLPYVRVREPNGFWQYNRVLLERLVVATVFGGVLLAGLTGALASLKPLFGVSVSPKAYALLSTWVSFVFHPWFFLAGAPADLSALESRREYPRTLRVFAQFILVPLVVVYQVLLTAYLVKVIATGQWPRGLIGWLVSVEATAGILALLLIHPVREQAGNLWVRTFSRGFYLALLPSIAMLAISIAKRVTQYGITEDRYFVIVLTAWLAAISVTFIVRRDADIRLIPITLAALAAATLGGPWGPYRISLLSQREHLIRVLEANGLWRDGRFRTTERTLPVEPSKEISSTITYLIRAHGSGALRPLFGDQVAAADSGFTRPRGTMADVRARQLMSRLGLAYVSSWEAQQGTDEVFSFTLPYLDTAEATRVDGFDYHARIDTPDRTFRVGERKLRFDLDEAGRRMVLTEQTATAQAETLGSMPLDSAIAVTRSGRANVAGVPLRLELSGQQVRGFARFTSFSGRLRPALSVYGLTGDLYFTLGGASHDSAMSVAPAAGAATTR